LKIIHARWLFDGEKIVENVAIAFDTHIEEIAPFEVLETKFPQAETVRLGSDALVMPGLVNPHVHLEFGANTTRLRYGDFMAWLDSVIAHRDALIEACKASCYKKQIDAMLRSGTTTFGAVSSYGGDFTACKAAPQRVVYFSEIIGSQPAAVDALYADFMQRLDQAREVASDRFIPAVAIHSPYSVHPILMKKVLTETPKMPLSAHFLESPAEKAWLEKGSGPFARFFETFLKQTRPLQTPEAFLDALERPTLLVHAVQAEKKHLKKMAEAGHTVVHCPRSNRYLGCGRLAIERLLEEGIDYMLGTDGLSSNTSLSLWDEMRAALMLHHEAPLDSFATDLLRRATAVAAKSLTLRTGRLEVGLSADLITLTLPGAVEEERAVALQAILHTQEVTTLYIGGKQYV